jgi:hypothetical protein
MVGRPVARMVDDGWTLEVNRVATDGTKNACSILYAAAWLALSLACPACIARSEIRDCSIFCKCSEKMKTPPSASNSPAQPIKTRSSKNSKRGCQKGSLYSPIRPITNATPETSRSISDIRSNTIVTDSDKNKKYPVDPYSLAGGIGLALPGVALLAVAFRRLWRMLR